VSERERDVVLWCGGSFERIQGSFVEMYGSFEKIQGYREVMMWCGGSTLYSLCPHHILSWYKVKSRFWLGARRRRGFSSAAAAEGL